MRRFSEKQRELYYLSPYTSVKILSAEMLLRQYLFDLEDHLLIQKDQAKLLLDGLATGLTEKQLTKLLENTDADEEPEIIIRRWMQMGILE